MIIYPLIVIAVLACDILSKQWAASYILTNGAITVIKDVFYLSYVENNGAAFSMLKGQRTFFIVLTVVALAVIILAFFKNWLKGKWGRTTLALIFAGALGNLIDRVLHGYVVDMFDFRIIHFPVFNVADIALTVGAIMGIIYILFMDRDLLDGKNKDKK